jgi:hypothetical protein
MIRIFKQLVRFERTARLSDVRELGLLKVEGKLHQGSTIKVSILCPLPSTVQHSTSMAPSTQAVVPFQ